MRRLAVYHGARLLLDGVRLAERPWQRMRGLLLRPCPDERGGLLILPCNSVHMFGMRYALDVLFLDREGRVLRAVTGLRPWRAAWAPRAHAALELAPGSIERLGIEGGMRLTWREVA